MIYRRRHIGGNLGRFAFKNARRVVYAEIVCGQHQIGIITIEDNKFRLTGKRGERKKNRKKPNASLS